MKTNQKAETNSNDGGTSPTPLKDKTKKRI